MQDKIAMQCYVAGRVQGVWFRAGAQSQAVQLGLTGWARNLPDGRVEVMACGERDAVEALMAWLQQGPEHAEVRELVRNEVPWQSFERFAIL